MRKLFIIVLSLLTCFFCCISSSAPDKTTLLKNYFKTTFNLEVPQLKHCYIFIDLDYCSSCKQSIVPTINSIKENKNITVVACFKRKASKKLLEQITFKNILVDKKSYFYSLDIFPNKNALIITEKGKISSIEEFTFDSKEKIDLLF